MVDGRIGPAVEKFRQAVTRLTQPQTRIHLDAVIFAPSLYDQLRGDLAGTQGDTRTAAKSLPPIWVDAADLLKVIDRTTQGWQPKHSTTVDRLLSLSGFGWRPQDTDHVDTMTGCVEGWCVQILALLDPQATKTISAPCPQCSKDHVYRRDKAGEMVRKPALQLVTNTGCSCLACNAFWPPEQYMWLNRLLGFDRPEGVCDGVAVEDATA